MADTSLVMGAFFSFASPVRLCSRIPPYFLLTREKELCGTEFDMPRNSASSKYSRAVILCSAFALFSTSASSFAFLSFAPSLLIVSSFSSSNDLTERSERRDRR